MFVILSPTSVEEARSLLGPHGQGFQMQPGHLHLLLMRSDISDSTMAVLERVMVLIYDLTGGTMRNNDVRSTADWGREEGQPLWTILEAAAQSCYEVIHYGYMMH
jgi:hypothetical protein